MNLPRVALGLLLSAGSVVLACSDSETIVALNVTSDRAYVGEAAKLRVSITQPGKSAPATVEFTPPNSPVDGGALQINEKVVHRITLPDGWEEVESTAEVEAVGTSGQVTVKSNVKFLLHPEETTAVFVDLKKPPEPPAPTGGTGAGGDGAGGAPAAGGTDAGGAGVGGAAAGAASTEAGIGGQPGAAGASAGNGGNAGS